MILIFGGAYQGKLKYAIDNLKLGEEDIFYCRKDSELDYSKAAICGLQEYVKYCVEKGIEAKDFLEIDRLKNKIIICDDTSQGLVPMDAAERAYREMVGRTLLMLGKEADEVVRVFCGLGSKLK